MQILTTAREHTLGTFSNKLETCNVKPNRISKLYRYHSFAVVFCTVDGYMQLDDITGIACSNMDASICVGG